MLAAFDEDRSVHQRLAAVPSDESRGVGSSHGLPPDGTSVCADAGGNSGPDPEQRPVEEEISFVAWPDRMLMHILAAKTPFSFYVLQVVRL